MEMKCIIHHYFELSFLIRHSFAVVVPYLLNEYLQIAYARPSTVFSHTCSIHVYRYFTAENVNKAETHWKYAYKEKKID